MFRLASRKDTGASKRASKLIYTPKRAGRPASSWDSTALHAYGRAYHHQVAAGSSSKTFGTMTNGRNYKVVVAFHNRYGYSSWSTLHTVSPGAVPSIGGSPRYLVWKNGAYVHYGWNRSRDNGSPVTHYETAIRCQRISPASGWGGWVNNMMPGTKDVYINFRRLGTVRTCQVRVHAKDGFGSGAWSSPRTVRR